MYMTEEEICRDFRLTKDSTKADQIKILAERNLCTQEEIIAILERHEESIPVLKNRRPDFMEIQNRSKKRSELYRQGLADKEIAVALHELYETAKAWRKRNGLPPNKKRRVSYTA